MWKLLLYNSKMHGLDILIKLPVKFIIYLYKKSNVEKEKTILEEQFYNFSCF